jgi:flagellar biosynthesis regulator FlaF
MQTLANNDDTQEYVIDLQAFSAEGGEQMEEYLHNSTKMLEEITERANRGETIDRDSHDWMLKQMDIVVESLGSETLELSDAIRSNLLQFILAIANVNEQIRHRASLSL